MQSNQALAVLAHAKHSPTDVFHESVRKSPIEDDPERSLNAPFSQRCKQN
jgi:hypothetical protein